MLEQTIKRINTSLASLLKDVQKRYSLGLVSDSLFTFSKEFILRKGKRIRPLLFILSYKGYTKKQSSRQQRLFRSAAAIELLHDFLLIHDDVIDNSDLRRGKPTLHQLFNHKLKLSDHAKIGPELAIISGDIIFALAIEAFLSVDENFQRKEKALKELVVAAAYTGAGEFTDVAFSHFDIDRLSEKKIFLNYSLKTAKYTFECPLLMGALLAGASKEELKKLSKIGIAAGQAFQIYDDLLDLFSTEKIIGKSTLTDLAESKKTLLVFKAYKNLKASDKSQFKKILEKKNKNKTDLALFKNLIVKSGSYDHCLQLIHQLQTTALATCHQLKMRASHKQALIAVISKLSSSHKLLKIKQSS